MFPDLKLWESKLEYLKAQLEEFTSLDRSWYKYDQWQLYYDMVAKMERKIAEYQRLVDYLKEIEENEED